MNQSNETILDVDGMTCPSCVRHVEGALRQLEGIGAVEVRIKEGKVRVEHDAARSSIGQLIAALGDAGYESRPAGA